MNETICGCGAVVNPVRVEFGYENCIDCANSNPRPRPMGRMVYDGKVGAEIEILDADTYNANKKYFTPNGARSALKNFSKNICS